MGAWIGTSIRRIEGEAWCQLRRLAVAATSRRLCATRASVTPTQDVSAQSRITFQLKSQAML